MPILSLAKSFALCSYLAVRQLCICEPPVRDAYQQVGLAIENGSFTYSGTIHHTHEGSIGNLCLDKIRMNFENVRCHFPFDKINRAIHELIELK